MASNAAMAKLATLLLLCVIPLFARAEPAPIERFGLARALREVLPADRLRLVIWNVHKGEDANLVPDFARLAQGADLALFQEAVDQAPWLRLLEAARADFRWSLAQSWQGRSIGGFTGVATGSRAEPVREIAVRTVDGEPIVDTPKTILASEYRLEGRADTLLVINAHAINFTTLAPLARQLDQLIDIAAEHAGPLVVGGDFNTWSGERFLLLRGRLAELGLERAIPVGSALKNLPFDHLFTRGFAVESLVIDDTVRSSDHAPAVATLRYRP